MTNLFSTLLAKESLCRLVDEIKTLPSLPALYRELTEVLRSPDASIESTARIISKDMGMTTKILQLVNSPFFGLRTFITSPAKAVAFLGLDQIKPLVLSMQVFSQFRESQHPFFSLEVLWRHGLVTGTSARAIAKEEQASQDLIDAVFTAGLLHDIGILILSTNLPDRYTDALALMLDRGIAEWEAECEVFGASHEEVGGYLLGTWGLSNDIVEAVAFHHEPMRSVSQPFSPLAAVHVANALVEQDEASAMGGTPTSVDADYLASCGLANRLAIWRMLGQGSTLSRTGV